ncbi:hypothetical protein [Kitasatospora sp. NPDC002965]|uniref:hypothetical protein n=1 Tax=Kitasatospora sp. NPDC002965 TaxID=3154775 RepID=UPI0033B6B353
MTVTSTPATSAALAVGVHRHRLPLRPLDGERAVGLTLTDLDADHAPRPKPATAAPHPVVRRLTPPLDVLLPPVPGDADPHVTGLAKPGPARHRGGAP